MLQDHPHAIHFKHILYFGEGQGRSNPSLTFCGLRRRKFLSWIITSEAHYWK